MQHGGFPDDPARVEFTQEALHSLFAQMPQTKGPVRVGKPVDLWPVRCDEALVSLFDQGSELLYERGFLAGPVCVR